MDTLTNQSNSLILQDQLNGQINNVWKNGSINIYNNTYLNMSLALNYQLSQDPMLNTEILSIDISGYINTGHPCPYNFSFPPITTAYGLQVFVSRTPVQCLLHDATQFLPDIVRRLFDNRITVNVSLSPEPQFVFIPNSGNTIGVQISSPNAIAALAPKNSVPFITLYANASAQITFAIDFNIPQASISFVPTISALGCNQLNTNDVPLRYQTDLKNPNYWDDLKKKGREFQIKPRDSYPRPIGFYFAIFGP